MQTLSLFYLILLQEKNDENKLKYFVLACEKLQMSPIVYYYWLLNLHAKHFSLLLSFGSRQFFFFGGRWRVLCLVAQSCRILCDPMNCIPPGSSVYGIFQARILKWVAISSSRESSWPSDQICIFQSPALQVDSLPLRHWGSQE